MRYFRHSPLFDSLFDFDPFVAPRGYSTVPALPAGTEIEAVDENHTRLILDLAGFSEDELAIEVRGDILEIKGETEDGRRVVDRRFRLGEHQEVVGAKLDKGLLVVDVKRELPEAMKPRRIEIETSLPKALAGKAKKLIEGGQKAA